MYIDCNLRFIKTIIDIILEWIAINAEIVIITSFLFIFWKKFSLIAGMFSFLIRERKVEIEEIIVIYEFTWEIWIIEFLEIIIIIIITFWCIKLLKFKIFFHKLLNFVMSIISLINDNTLIKQLCEDFDRREIY